MPLRVALDELLRVGAIVRQPDGRLAPVTRAYVPQLSQAEKLELLGADVADLVDTIDHNLQRGATDPRFQRKVAYQSIATKHLPAFREISATQAQALLEKLDRWLAEYDQIGPGEPHVPRAHVDLGIYYMEERLEGAKS